MKVIYKAYMCILLQLLLYNCSFRCIFNTVECGYATNASYTTMSSYKSPLGGGGGASAPLLSGYVFVMTAIGAFFVLFVQI